MHLISMQLTSRASLRDGIASLKARIKNLYHLGVKPVARSTFADANHKRPASFFATVFASMYQRCLTQAPPHKFKFKNKLYSLGATVISLCLTLFPWASFRRTRAGVKLHTLLDHDGKLPAFVAITAAREHEIKKARTLNLPKGSLVVEDLGYTDYAWYGRLNAQKIFFVTRLKSKARYRVLERRPVNTKLGLVSDETIQLSGAKGRECPKPLRRIVYQDLATGKVYVFLSNHFRLAAKTIADIYKERRQIEIFFRDATAIEGRERPVAKVRPPKPAPRKKGRPRRGEVQEPKPETRLQRQVRQAAAEALAELPVHCDVGTKKNSKGYKETWIGYKLHADVSDSCLPISVALTAASVHDSQVAIPLMKTTSERVDYLYDVMDAAFDAQPIYEVSRSLGHVPIIDRNSRGKDIVPLAPHEAVRYRERSVAERFNSRLKEDFEAANVMVRGANKVRLHLMFGVIALFADQLLKLIN